MCSDIGLDPLRRRDGAPQLTVVRPFVIGRHHMPNDGCPLLSGLEVAPRVSEILTPGVCGRPGGAVRGWRVDMCCVCCNCVASFDFHLRNRRSSIPLIPLTRTETAL